MVRIVFLLLFSHFAWAQATSSLRYEGVLQGGAVSTGTSTQSFTVTIDRPDCPADTLGLTAWTNASVTVVDGAFTLNPSFSTASLQNALNPATVFGGCPVSVYSARRLKITWNTAPAETFYIPLDDSPRATFSNVAANSNAIGGVSVQPAMSCASGNVLKYNSGLLRFECQPLAASDIPTLSASVISSGTFSAAQMPAPGGDISGTYSAMSLDRIRGTSVSATAPTVNQVLKYNGTAWTPAADDAGAAVGDATYAAKGVVQVDTSAAFSGLQLTTGVLSLAPVGTAGTYGSAVLIPIITTDAKGRITTVTTAAPSDATKLPLAGGTMAGSIDMGAFNMTNAINIASTNISTRNLILNDNDTNTITVRSPTNITTNYSLTLPADDGSTGQVLSTDGAGILSWITPGGGGTGDVNNNGNSFGAVMNIGTNDAQDLFFETSNTARMQIRTTGEVGIGTTPTTGMGLDLAGPFNMRHTTTPANASAGQGRIYYDSTTNRFRVSQNGGAYVDMINSASISGNGTAGYLSKWGSTDTIIDSVIMDTGTNIGINVVAPLERLDLNGGINMRGIPGLPPGGNSLIGHGKIYFNSSTGKFRVSEDGNATWHDLVNTDVISNVTYYDDIFVANCTSFQTLYWHLINDRWECQDINSTVAGGFIRESGNNFGFDMTIGTNSNQSVNIETNGSTRMTISDDGLVGIGTTTPTAPLHTQATLNQTTGTTHNGYFSTLVMPMGAHSGTASSLTSEMNIIGSNNVAQAYAANIRSFSNTTAFITENAGLNVLNQKSGSGTTNSAKGVSSSLQADQGAITSAAGIISDVRTTGSGAMGDVRGVSSVISNSPGNSMYDITAYSASVANNTFGTNSVTGLDIMITGAQNPTTTYGVKIGSMNGLTKYAIHQSDATARNYFNGNVGIGTTNPSANLDVQGTVRLGTSGTPLTRVIVCNGVSFTNGTSLPAGSAAIVASNPATCTGVVIGMTFSCSLDSENMSVTSYMPMTANSGDQGNQQIRMRVLNPTVSLINTSAWTGVFTCVGTRN